MPLFFALFSGNWTRKGANMNDETLRVYLKNNCYGKSHLIAGNTLEQQLHINGSDLRKRINRLRRKGVPIASRRLLLRPRRERSTLPSAFCGR